VHSLGAIAYHNLTTPKPIETMIKSTNQARNLSTRLANVISIGYFSPIAFSPHNPEGILFADTNF
jgi:hypothetical protein